MAVTWQSRIVGHGVEAPDQLLANPENWRVHPRKQQRALEQALDKTGWVRSVLVNTTTGHVVDGHLRVGLAISKGELEIPVEYVELTEDEERLVLASLDPISTLAVTDQASLMGLLSGVEAEAELDDLLRATAGLTDGKSKGFSQEDAEAREQELQTAFTQDPDTGIVNVQCPDCGAEFGVAV